MATFKRILCPVDFGEPTHASLAKAADLAACCSAELLVLNVVPPVPVIAVPQAAPEFDVPKYQRRLVTVAEESLGRLILEKVPKTVNCRTRVVDGEPLDEILQVAREEQVDLIVMGTHGQSGWRHLISGSVTHDVIHTMRLPVMLVPEAPEP